MESSSPLTSIEAGLYSLFAGPESGGRNRITDLAPITEGWENEVYSFILVSGPGHPPGREPLILRLYPGTNAVQKSGWEREALSRLHAFGYPVPKVRAASSDPAPFGKPWLVMERIEGPTLGNAFAQAVREEKAELLSQFCRLYAGLHALDWRDLVEDPTLYEGDTRSFVRRELGRWRHIVAGLGLGDWESLRTVMAWLEENVAHVPSRSLCGIHNDFHSENVLIRRPDGRAFVIDWGGFDVGDPRADLAWTLLLAGEGGNRELRDLVRDEYLRHSNASLEGMEFFDAMAAARRLFSVLLSIRAGADRLGMRPGMEGRFNTMQPHLRYVYGVFRDRTGLRLPDIEDDLSIEP